MNQLQKYPISPALIKEEREIVEASLGQKIKNLTDNQIKDAILKIITKTFFDAGQKSQDAAPYAAEMTVSIKRYFSTLSVEEISLCFFKGARGEFGEYFGLNPVSFYGWISKYMTSEARKTAKLKQLAFEVPEKRQLTEAEKEAIVRAGLIKCFEDFKAKGILYDADNVNYNLLDRWGKIPFTKGRKKEFIGMAQARLKAEEKEKMERSGDLKQIRTMNEAIKELGDPKNDQVIREAKRIALKVLFQDMIDTEMDIKDLMENLINEKHK